MHDLNSVVLFINPYGQVVGIFRIKRKYGCLDSLFGKMCIRDSYWNGLVYVAFSGGLDSVVLLHKVRKILGDYIPAVFSNTGLEFPEIVRFARSAPGEFIEIKPLDKKTGKRITYRDVILRAGYPLVSKETADKLYKLRHGNLSPRYRNYILNGDERGRFGMLPKKWRFLIEAPFEISGKCCDLLKKGPLKEYEKQTGRKPFVGVTQDEGFRREHQYAKTGCNVYDGSTIKSQPLGFWTRQDILRYIIWPRHRANRPVPGLP